MATPFSPRLPVRKIPRKEIMDEMLTKAQTRFLHELVERYGDLLEKYCLRHLQGMPSPEQTAQDIVQSTYLDALENVSRLMEHPNVIAWLMAVCKNHLADEWKKYDGHPLLPMSPEQIEALYDKQRFEESLVTEAQQRLSEIRVIVGKLLSEDERKVFNSVYLEGYSLKETAQRSQMKMGVVRSKIYAIRRKFKLFFILLCFWVLQNR